MAARAKAPTVDEVRGALHRLFIGVRGTALRKEDEVKAVELAAMLKELSRFRRDALLVDAAAGKAPVGLLAAELLGFARIAVIERDAGRVEACREAAARLTRRAEIEVRHADVGDLGAWPEAPDVVAALHACGFAADAVIDAAARARARFILLVPCCYGKGVAFAGGASKWATLMGAPRQGAVRRRLLDALVDAERTLRLESYGYEVTVAPLVSPTVTPHNLLWRARRAVEPRAMERARASLEQLREALGA
ncbi:MAG: methyltransferase [Deltaproteobacteria bacterium]|nr:methyltransferase [Deltaproteobacteria bacterium]